jgi:hypothetical protein
VPHGTSNEFYKAGVLDGDSPRSSSRVCKESPTTRTHPLETATVNTTPQLEILADDVKCAHGAIIGQPGSDALFAHPSARRRRAGLTAFASGWWKIRVAPLREGSTRLPPTCGRNPICHDRPENAVPLPATALDVEKIRGDFPILREMIHGKPLVYLDSANTQKPSAVEAIDAITATTTPTSTVRPICWGTGDRISEGRERSAASSTPPT